MLARPTARTGTGDRLPALLTACWLCCVVVACTPPEEHRRRTLAAADELLARGDRAAAVATLESFLRYDPRDVAVTVQLARLDLVDGQGHVALGRLESLPSGAPKDDEYFETLARARVHAGRLEQALPMLLARPGLAESDPGLVDELVKRSVQATHLALPDLPAPWRARRVDGMIRAGSHLPAILDQWRRLPGHAPDRTRLLELLIQAALARDDLDLLRQAEEVHAAPVSPWKLLARHHLYLARGEEGEAGEVERLFVRKYPGHPRRFDVLMSLLRRENRSGRPEEALRLADEAAALRPSDTAPMMEKALALRHLGREEKAREQLELVLTQDPNHEAARLLLRRDDDARRERQARDTAPKLGRLELSLETEGS